MDYPIAIIKQGNELTDLSLLFKGALLGVSIAAPVGPIGILCIRTSIAEGSLKGFVAGLGAASADAVYGSIAALGLSTVSQFLISQGQWIRFIGGLFLAYLGISSIVKKAETSPNNREASGYVRTYTSTLFLTLTNPLTILSFTAIFAGIGIINRNTNIFSAGLMVLGVFIGSASWWLALSWGASKLGATFDNNLLLWVNRCAGIMLLGFALLALYSAIIGW